MSGPKKPVTLCALTYGDHPGLIRRLLESVRACCDRSLYRLVVGANATSQATLNYLTELQDAGIIDRLHVSAVNLNKNPMMGRMFRDIDTEFIWWFDDDSYIVESDALESWLRIARRSPETTVQWGWEAGISAPAVDLEDESAAVRFVRSASWYRGLTPPFRAPGGKGEFAFEGKNQGDGVWRFIAGACWLMRSRAIRALDWPDRRLTMTAEDIFLGEAIRQQGWSFLNLGRYKVSINAGERRGVHVRWGAGIEENRLG